MREEHLSKKKFVEGPFKEVLCKAIDGVSDVQYIADGLEEIVNVYRGGRTPRWVVCVSADSLQGIVYDVLDEIAGRHNYANTD